jgi:hypothetical protein
MEIFTQVFSFIAVFCAELKKSGFLRGRQDLEWMPEPTTSGDQSADGLNFQLFSRDFPGDDVRMELLLALSSFFYICAILVGPLAWGLIFRMKSVARCSAWFPASSGAISICAGCATRVTESCFESRVLRR